MRNQGSRIVRPDGGLRSKGGGNVSPGGGMLGTVFSTPCEFTPTDLSTQLGLLNSGNADTLRVAMGLAAGKTPSNYALLNESDGGSDKVGSSDLTVAQSVPLFQVANAALDGFTGMHNNSSLDAVDCVDNTGWEPGNASFAYLFLTTYDSLSGNNKYLFGKGNTTTGVTVRGKNTGALEFTTFHASGSVVTTLSEVHYSSETRGSLVLILCGSDRNANTSRIFSTLGGDSSSSIAQANDLTQASLPFGVGQSVGSTHANKPAMVAYWTGTAAEGIVSQATVDTLAAYLGVGIYDDVLTF